MSGGGTTPARPARLLAFAGSLREGSHNRKLVALAGRLARAAGAEVDLADFREFAMPIYDGDVETGVGLPEGARELGRRLGRADGLLLASPEYNYSLPGTLKNAIDWVSRARPSPWRGKSALLLAASPGAIGGIRGLWQLRIPLEGCGVLVYPDMFTVARAADAFDEGGELKDAAQSERLRKLVADYLALAARVHAPADS